MNSSVPIATPLANCMPAELLASPVFLLARLGISVKMRAFDEFEQAGFSPYHHSVLALLDEGARDTQSAIADALQLNRSQLVGLLDALEERQLIERRPDPNDRRRHVVSLTESGRRQLAEFRTIIKRIEGEFLAPLDSDDRAALHALLARLAAHHDPRYVADVRFQACEAEVEPVA
jgi:MarR family transcriptional regulator, lower aerobic nicotinate degradation pathway regulator